MFETDPTLPRYGTDLLQVETSLLRQSAERLFLPLSSWRKELIPHLPHCFHVEFFAGEDDLRACFVLAVFEIACHVHPADAWCADGFSALSDDEIHVDGQTGPVINVLRILDLEDFTAIASARP